MVVMGAVAFRIDRGSPAAAMSASSALRTPASTGDVVTQVAEFAAGAARRQQDW